MSLKIAFLMLFCVLFATAEAGETHLREHQLNSKVTIFSDDGKLWGAMVDGKVVLEATYNGIDLLGDKYLRLMKYDSKLERILYGSADYTGAIKLKCDYEHLVLNGDKVETFKPLIALKIATSAPEPKKEPIQKAIEEPQKTVAKKEKEQEIKVHVPDISVAIDGALASDSTETVDADGVPEQSAMKLLEDENRDPIIDLARLMSQAKKEANIKDVKPLFPGGELRMNEFLRDNLEFPEESKVNGTQGRVVVRFVVNVNGSLSDIEIIRGLDPSCNQEAIRVIGVMPRWVAGSIGGDKAPMSVTIPIAFSLTMK